LRVEAIDDEAVIGFDRLYFGASQLYASIDNFYVTRGRPFTVVQKQCPHYSVYEPGSGWRSILPVKTPIFPGEDIAGGSILHQDLQEPKIFNCECYIARYSSVRNTKGMNCVKALEHWHFHGINNNWDPSCSGGTAGSRSIRRKPGWRTFSIVSLYDREETNVYVDGTLLYTRAGNPNISHVYLESSQMSEVGATWSKLNVKGFECAASSISISTLQNAFSVAPSVNLAKVTVAGKARLGAKTKGLAYDTSVALDIGQIYGDSSGLIHVEQNRRVTFGENILLLPCMI